MCGAPIIMQFIIGATPEERRPLPRKVEFMTAAAPPPAAVLEALEKENFHVTHVYGLTEVYGPATICSWHEEWDALPSHERARLKARQGVRYAAEDGVTVMDPTTMKEVPRDGTTMGEVMFRGNLVMKGYLKNPTATQEAFEDGWFHSGDLGVLHEDGYIELRDRSKDIIISGGENISTIEVEGVIIEHPAVANVAVVAKPDEKWGETPCAFVVLKPGADGHGRGDHRPLPRQPRLLQMPAPRGVPRPAHDLDRQGAEVRAARLGQGGLTDTPGRHHRAAIIPGYFRRFDARRLNPHCHDTKRRAPPGRARRAAAQRRARSCAASCAAGWAMPPPTCWPIRSCTRTARRSTGMPAGRAPSARWPISSRRAAREVLAEVERTPGRDPAPRRHARRHRPARGHRPGRPLAASSPPGRPRPSFVFLVGDRPVIVAWGYEKEAAAALLPLATAQVPRRRSVLEPSPAPPSPANAAVTAGAAARGRVIPWARTLAAALPLLLLVLGGAWLLRGCCRPIPR